MTYNCTQSPQCKGSLSHVSYIVGLWFHEIYRKASRKKNGIARSLRLQETNLCDGPSPPVSLRDVYATISSEINHTLLHFNVLLYLHLLPSDPFHLLWFFFNATFSTLKIAMQSYPEPNFGRGSMIWPQGLLQLITCCARHNDGAVS